MHLNDPSEEKIIKDILKFWAPEYEVWAFGSRVTGERVKKFSDLDLVIKTEKPIPIRQFARVKDAFTLCELPYRTDLLEWAYISPEFRKIIESKYEVVQSGGGSEVK